MIWGHTLECQGSIPGSELKDSFLRDHICSRNRTGVCCVPEKNNDPLLFFQAQISLIIATEFRPVSLAHL